MHSIKAILNGNICLEDCARVSDSVALIIYCKQHDTLVLHRHTDPKKEGPSYEEAFDAGYRWLPFGNITSNMSFVQAALDVVSIVYKKIMQENMFETLRVVSVYSFEMPNHLDEVLRYIILAIPNPQIKCFCSPAPYERALKDDDFIEILPLKKIITMANFWGPEVGFFAAKLSASKGSDSSMIDLSFSHYSLAYVTSLVSFNDNKAWDNCYEEMLRHSNLGEDQVLNLFKTFLETTYPCFVMNRNNFYDFMKFYELETQHNRLVSYFNAFAINKKIFLTFYEFILGLIAIDQKAVLCEARLKIIFRFYDKDKDGFLSPSEFKTFMEDLNPDMAPDKIPAAIDSMIQTMRLTFNLATVKQEHFINFTIFFNSVKRKIIQGIHIICRSNVDIFQTIQLMLCSMDVSRTQKDKQARKVKKPTLRVVKRKKDKELIDDIIIDSIGQIECCEAATPIIKLAYHYLNILSQVQSMKTLLKNNASSPILKISEIKMLLEFCRTCLLSEKNILEIGSDCLILGDLNGQFDNLLELSKTFWPLFPALDEKKILFLGNYIHPEQKQSIFVLLYLICLKIISPNDIILLRGRSEIRESENNKAFKEQLSQFFDKNSVNSLYDDINEVLNYLPIAAIVYNKLLCCSGGVPTMKYPSTVLALNQQFPKPDPKFAQHGPTNPLWQLIWNVPLRIPLIQEHFEEFIDDSELAQKDKDELTAQYKLGFVANMRTLNHYYYSRRATDQFLENSNLSHLIVTNPDGQAGFDQMFHNRLLILSTCSSYDDSPTQDESKPAEGSNDSVHKPSKSQAKKLYLLQICETTRLMTLIVYETEKQTHSKESLSVIKN